MPRTMDIVERELDAATRDPRLTPEEQDVVQSCYPTLSCLGTFHRQLYELMRTADMHNLARIEAGFPAEVAAFKAWRTGALRRRLQELGYRGLGL